MFQLGSYGGLKRLAGLTWGAEDLPAAIGAATSREPDGRYTPPYELARSLCLFGAAAAGVAPIETVYPAFRDLDGLAAYAGRARRDGFTGMMAIHPDQVPAINAAFTPSEAEVAHARAVVAAFEAHPGAGTLSLDGRMIDRPHLVQAQRTLAAAAGSVTAMPAPADAAWTALAFILGAAIGSFLATILMRWPQGRSVVAGRSRCDNCGRTLGAARPRADPFLVAGEGPLPPLRRARSTAATSPPRRGRR